MVTALTTRLQVLVERQEATARELALLGAAREADSRSRQEPADGQRSAG